MTWQVKEESIVFPAFFAKKEEGQKTHSQMSKQILALAVAVVVIAVMLSLFYNEGKTIKGRKERKRTKRCSIDSW